MVIFIELFGVFLMVAGVVLLVRPNSVFSLLGDYSDRYWLYVSAIMGRIVLGGVLVYIADASRFPLAMVIIGWISIIAALSFAAIGQGRFRQLLSWVLSFFKPFARAGGLVSTAFGAFLIYAFV